MMRSGRLCAATGPLGSRVPTRFEFLPNATVAGLRRQIVHADRRV